MIIANSGQFALKQERGCYRTIFSRVEVHKISNADVDDTKEPLVLLLKLLLVEYLHCKYTVLSNAPAVMLVPMRVCNQRNAAHLEGLIPVWVQSLLDDLCSFCLLSIDSCDCEWVRETCGRLSAVYL